MERIGGGIVQVGEGRRLESGVSGEWVGQHQGRGGRFPQCIFALWGGGGDGWDGGWDGKIGEWRANEGMGYLVRFLMSFFWHYMHQQSSMTQWDTMCSYLMMLSVQIDKQSMAFEALTAVRMVIVSHGVIGWWTHFHAESHLWTSKFCLIIDSTQGSISRWSLWGTALTLCLLLLSIPCTV